MLSKSLFPFLQNLYRRFQDDEVPALGAQLTYYLILSFFPFIIFLITLTAYTPLNRQDVLTDVIALMPATVSGLVEEIFRDILREHNSAILSVGMIAAIWTASNGMMAIIRTLNKAYDVEERRSYWKVRGISILYTLGFTIVILLSLVMLVFGRIIGLYAYRFFDLPASFEQLWGPLNNVLSLVLMCTIFAMLYYSAPSRRMRISDVVPGALFATMGWVITSLAFSYYVNHFSSYSKTYGSLGGITVLLIWLYICSILLLLGGEINATLTFDREGKKKTGSKSFGFRFPFTRSTKN